MFTFNLNQKHSKTLILSQRYVIAVFALAISYQVITMATHHIAHQSLVLLTHKLLQDQIIFNIDIIIPMQGFVCNKTVILSSQCFCYVWHYQ